MKQFKTVLLFALLVGAANLALLSSGCKKDDGGTNGGGGGPTPITDDLFPLVALHQFVYAGYLVDTNAVTTPVAGTAAVYRTTWTLIPNPTGDGSYLIKDSTSVGTPGTPRFLQIKKDSSGSYWFRQTLGPFYRAIARRGVAITYSDTLIWVLIVKPSAGVGGTWVAFDSTWTGTFGGSPVPVRLTINGSISYPVSITDSTILHTQYSTYLSATTRTVVIGPTTVADGAITGRFWLAKDIGPVQVNIAGDAENYGHWRVMKSKTF